MADEEEPVQWTRYRRRRSWSKRTTGLKRLVADLTLDQTMLQDVLSKEFEAFATWADGGAPGW